MYCDICRYESAHCQCGCARGEVDIDETDIDIPDDEMERIDTGHMGWF